MFIRPSHDTSRNVSSGNSQFLEGSRAWLEALLDFSRRNCMMTARGIQSSDGVCQANRTSIVRDVGMVSPFRLYTLFNQCACENMAVHQHS